MSDHKGPKLPMPFSNDGGEAENSNQSFEKSHPGFWRIPPRVRGPTRVLENSTGLLEKYTDLVIEVYISLLKKCKM